MKRFQNYDSSARAPRRFTSAGIRLLLNFSLILTLLFSFSVGKTWAEPYMSSFGIQFRDDGGTWFKTGTKDGCSSGVMDCDFGSKTNLKIVYVYANGNKNGGNLCGNNYFKYEIYGPTGTANWDGINRSSCSWSGSTPTYKWGTEDSSSAWIDLVQNRMPGDYSMQFIMSFNGANSGDGCGSWYDCKYSGTNWYFTWSIPDPTITITGASSLVVGTSTDIKATITDYPIGATVTKVRVTGNIASAKEKSGSADNLTVSSVVPNASGSNGITVTVTVTYGSAGTKDYTYNYNVSPPAVSGFTVTPSGEGYVSGTGTDSDPYIMKHNEGNLVLTMSGSQAHTDANSSAKYYNGSTWSGTATKTIYYASGSTTKQSITLKMKYNNSTASLDGAVSEKTVYYQRETAYTVSKAATTGGSFTVTSPAGAKSGGAVTATPSTGYSFSAWSITDGSGTWEKSTSTASNTFYPTSISTIKATFAAKNYTVTLNKNGGVADGTVQTTYNANATAGFTAVTRTGYTCDGYYTLADGGYKVINANGTLVDGSVSEWLSSGYWIKDAATITLYAHWTPITYTITLDPNGGTSGTTSLTIDYDGWTPYTDGMGNGYFEISNPTKSGYAFTGWFTNDGRKVIDENGFLLAPVTGYTANSPANHWIGTTDTTLYAHWQAVSTVPADPSLDDCQVTGLFGLSSFTCQGLQGGCIGVTETIGGKDTRHIYGQTGGNFYTNDLRNAPARDYVHFEVWAPEAFTFTAELVGYNNDFVYSSSQNYTTQAGSWKVVDVPLTAFSGYAACFAGAYIGFRLSNLANKDIWFANMYLYTSSSACAAEPASAPTAPSYSQCQVQSIFSDTYTSVGISAYYDWGGGGSTKTDRTVGGTNMYKVTVKNNYVGGFAINGKIDASAYEYIHMDVWTPLASTFRFSPICFIFNGGGDETEQYQTISTSAATWTSIDIPVSYFTDLGLTMRGNYQLKFDQCNSTYFWITNIYYYNTASCPSYTPVAGSKHFGTAQRQNVPLYSDADMATDRHANTGKILAQRFDYYIVDCGEQMLAKAVTRGKFGTGLYDQMVQVWNDAKTGYAENKLSQHNAAATEAFQRIGDADQYRWNGQTNTAPMNFYINSQEQTTGLGYSEFFDYQRGYINNPNADATVPTLTSVAKTEETNWFTLTFSGANDNSGQWFYYVEDTEFDYYKVSLEDTIRIPKVDNGQVFHFNCYAVDFNGNLSEAKAVTVEMPYTSPSTTNLALNKPIVAGAGSNITNINDGNLVSRNNGADTGSDYTNQWVYIDLEGYYTLSSIKIWFETACPSNYVLQACETLPATVNDDTQWRTIATRTSAPSTGSAVGNANIYDVRGSVARYVRLKSYSNYNNNAHGFSIFEFEVYGSAVATKDATAPVVTTAEATAIVNGDDLQLHLVANDGSTFFRIKDNETDELFLLEVDGSNLVVLDNKAYEYCTQYSFDIQAMDTAANLSAVATITPAIVPPALYNLATGATATAGHADVNTAAQAVDGNAGTRWSSNGGAAGEHWITVDLKKKYAISSVKLSWETACPKNYYLKASADGTNFYPVGHYTTVPATSGNGSAYETYTVPSGVEARYLQMYSVENNTVYGTSIFEFEAYGTCASNSDVPLMTFAELKDVPVSSTGAEAVINVGAWDDATAFGSLRYKVVFTAGGEATRTGLAATDGLLTLTGLTVGTTYTVRIYVVDGNSNESANYKELTFTPKVNLYYLTADATGTSGAWEAALANESSASRRRFADTEHEGIYTFSIAVAGTTQYYRLYFDEEGDLTFHNDNTHWSTAGNQQINNHGGETITVYAKDKDHFVSNFDEVYVYGSAVGAATEGVAKRMTNEGSTFVWQGAVTSGDFRIVVKATEGAEAAFTDHSRNRIMSAAETFTNSESLEVAKLTFDLETWTYTFERIPNYVIYHHDQAPDGGVEEYAGGTILQHIEYRRKFEKDTWYSIYFPFDVTAVQVIDDEDGNYYDLKPYYRTGSGVLRSRHYIIRKATPAEGMDISNFESKIGESGWLDPAGEVKTDVDDWLPEKNTPYMIQFHNDYYTDKWIVFIGATGSTIATDFELGDAPSDSGFVNIYGNNTLHSTSLTTRTYMINYDEYEGNAWTRFDAETTLYPFEVYMRADAETTEQHQVLGRRPKQEDTATSVEDIYTESSCLRVYSVTGQLLLTLYHITPDDAGRQLQQQLGQGIYILHSDHSSYKLIIGGH